MLSVFPDESPLSLKVNQSQYSPRLSELLNPPLVKIQNSNSPLPKDNNLDEGVLNMSPTKLDFSRFDGQNVEEVPNSDPTRDKRIYENLLQEDSDQPQEQNIIFEKRRLPLFYKHWSTGAVNNAALNSKNLRTRQRHEVQQIKQKLKTLDLAKEKSKLRNKLSPGLIKWNLLKHVLRSIMLLQHQSAVIIDESLSDHIHSEFVNSCSDIFIKLHQVETELMPIHPKPDSCFLDTKPMRGASSEDLKSLNETKASVFIENDEKENYQLGGMFSSSKVLEISSEKESAKEPQFEPSVLHVPLKPAKLNPVFEGLEKKRKLDKLFKLISEGNRENFRQIAQIVKEDPSSNLYEVNDNKHILNKKNDNNLTPLYMACQSGNLEIVKFLITMGANPRVPAILSQKELQTPLEVAARWNFIQIVSFLLNIHNFTKRELSSANACSMNNSIRGILKKKMEQKSKHKGCFCI